MTESSIKDAIMLFLKGEGIFAWRVGSSPYQRSGVPDILGVYRGFLIAIEVKTPEAYKKKDLGRTANQVLFMNRLEDNGALVITVCSAQQVGDFVQELKESLSEPSLSE